MQGESLVPVLKLMPVIIRFSMGEHESAAKIIIK